MKRVPLALNVIQKKVLCSAEKSSVIWAEPHSKSSAEQFDRTERSVYHYFEVLSSDFFLLSTEWNMFLLAKIGIL